MNPMLSLSRVYILELLREKLLVIGLIVSGALILLGLTLGSLSFDEKQRIFFHLAISTSHLISLILAVIYGSTTIAKEVERQTCLLVLARPVTRAQFFLAKYLSISFLILIFQVIVSTVILFILDSNFQAASYFKICLGIFLEVEIVLAGCFLISVLIRPSLAIFWGCGIFLLGNWLPELVFFASKSDSQFYRALSYGAGWFIPNLYILNWRSYQQLMLPMQDSVFLTACLHAVSWIGLYLAVGVVAWKRRDLV